MTHRIIVRLVSMVAALTACAAVAGAQDRDVDVLVKGKKALKRGSIQSLRGHKISISGRRTLTVGQVADRVFADDGELVGQFKRGRKGLKSDPVVSDEVVELDDATVLSTTTTITVTDPDAVRQSSPEFAKVRGGGARGVKVADLSAQARSDFDAFKKSTQSLAADHPLRKAAEAGEQQLLDAIASGQGDFTVSTTIVIPKRPLGRSASGKAIAPKTTADGSLDYAGSTMGSVADEERHEREREAKKGKTDEPKPPKVKEAGKVTHQAGFVTGFTKGDSFEWSRRWDVPTGFFRVKAVAWYDYGLRVPIRIDGTTRPGTITTKGTEDVDSEYRVSLKAAAIDADTAFYREAGLATSDLHDGQELVLGAGFQVTLTLKVMGIDIAKTLPKNGGFDFGQDFRPPFGDCGTKCGFDVWVPSSVTHTGIDILGILKGSARVGVNVSGDGKVIVDYTGKYGNDEVKSWLSTKNERSAQKRHELAFRGPGDEHILVQKADAIDRNQGGSKFYGYEVSKPRYEWKVALTPGVRADISVNAKPIFSDKFTIGPLWFHDLAIDLGTVKLGAHGGGKDAYTVKHGEKTFEKQ